MEADVFVYFVSIGAGLSFGLSLGIVPAVLVWRRMNRDRGGAGYARKAQKAHS